MPQVGLLLKKGKKKGKRKAEKIGWPLLRPCLYKIWKLAKYH